MFEVLDIVAQYQLILATGHLGAYMEHCLTTPYSNKATWQSVYEEIQFVGPKHCILIDPASIYNCCVLTTSCADVIIYYI